MSIHDQGKFDRNKGASSRSIAAFDELEEAKENGSNQQGSCVNLTRNNFFDGENPAEFGDDVVDPTKREEEYPHGTKLILLLLGIYVSVFLFALDSTIIATALPQITDEFKSFSEVGWYNAAFVFPMTAFQLFFGRLYTFYSPKWIFMSLVFVFEVGSAICGAAPNSIGFIWGRAVAGLGAGGLFNGSMILMMYAVPLRKRPLYLSPIGAVYGVASVAGPLLGGVFTTKVTWRWCFYLNLPVGAAVLAFLYFSVPSTPAALAHLPVRSKIARLDIYGTVIFLPCMVCLLLALQWGGQQYDWSDRRIIALFTLFGVLLIIFIVIQVWQQEYATVPPRIAKYRTIAAGAFYSFTIGSAFAISVYYLPIWFQAIKDDTAIRSGFATLPFIISLVIASILSGVLINKIGYYNPSIIACSILASIGTGLLTLFEPGTRHPMWIGFQVILGFGIGLGLQQAGIAAQTVLDKKDAPTGISLCFFGQGLGQTIGVSLGQNILDNKLIAGLSKINGVDPHRIINAGATDLRNMFSKEHLEDVLDVYNHAIVVVFYAALIFACAAIFGALTMEWKSVKTASVEDKPEPAMELAF